MSVHDLYVTGLAGYSACLYAWVFPEHCPISSLHDAALLLVGQIISRTVQNTNETNKERKKALSNRFTFTVEN